MLAKSREILHPSGLKLKTPLLIPSFSSKGFDIKNGKSEVRGYVELAKQFITESILISAYDLHYKFIPNINQMHFADITFIDSGGYETSNFYDFAEVKKKKSKSLKWNEKKHLENLKQWPNDYAAVLVNYDHHEKKIKLEKQIEEAKKLFKNFPDQLNVFLIKPEKKTDDCINLQKIVSSAHLLKEFTIIGMTEKELGNSTLERMQKISKIRKALDASGINAPMHIFGCLDPISCILYYTVGAEIFDGLSWLRYSYYNCLTTYIRNFNIINPDLDIDTEDEIVLSTSILKNIHFLARLKQKMIDLSKTEKFDALQDIVFPNMVETLTKSYNTFKNNEG